MSWASYSSLPSSDILTLFHPSPTQQIKLRQYIWLDKALLTSTPLSNTPTGSIRCHATADELVHSEITSSTRIVTGFRYVVRDCTDFEAKGSINSLDRYYLKSFSAILPENEYKLEVTTLQTCTTCRTSQHTSSSCSSSLLLRLSLPGETVHQKNRRS